LISYHFKVNQFLVILTLSILMRQALSPPTLLFEVDRQGCPPVSSGRTRSTFTSRHPTKFCSRRTNDIMSVCSVQPVCDIKYCWRMVWQLHCCLSNFVYCMLQRWQRCVCCWIVYDASDFSCRIFCVIPTNSALWLKTNSVSYFCKQSSFTCSLVSTTMGDHTYTVMVFSSLPRASQANFAWPSLCR